MGDRILHVSEATGWTGGTAQLLALAQGLRERGWDCRIGCRPGSGLGQHAEKAGLATFRVKLREDYDILSAWSLARHVEREGIALLHAHHNRSHAVCLLAKALLRLRGRDVQLVVSRRVSFAPGKNPFSRWKYTSGLIDCVVPVADAIRDVLVEAGVRPDKLRTIRSGVDARRFFPRRADPELRRRLGLPEGVAVVGKIANASPWKGQTVLLEAAAKLAAKGRRSHFLFAGRDTDSGWMKAEVARLGLETRVTLAGFRTDVPDLLSCLDVSVNAAVAGEGLSGALRESLAMGVPVVASDVAGNKELLGSSGAGGYLFKSADAQALAERLEWVLDHLEQARASAEEWRKTELPAFTLERTFDDTAALYRELLGKARSTPLAQRGQALR